MKFTKDGTVLPVVASLLIILMACWAFTQTSRAAEELAVRQRIAGYAEARRTGNGRAQAAFFTEDADEWGLARQMRKGRAQLEEGLSVPVEQSRQFKLDVTNVSFLRPDIAMVDGLYYGRSIEPAGHAFYLLVKQKGHWLIRSSRITRFPAQPQ